MPGVLGLQKGSTRIISKLPAGLAVGEINTSGVNVTPSVAVGVLLGGGASVSVGRAGVNVGAGVLVYSGKRVDAQAVAPCEAARFTILRIAARPGLVLA